MSAMRLNSPTSWLFTKPFIEGTAQRNVRAQRNWPLWGKFTGDRWIPYTKARQRGKCFHLMTSSLEIWNNRKGCDLSKICVYCDALRQITFQTPEYVKLKRLEIEIKISNWIQLFEIETSLHPTQIDLISTANESPFPINFYDPFLECLCNS